MYFKIFVAAISLRLLLFPFLSDAQNAHPAFKHYSVEDGLPSSEIYQVKQDSKGYIWFATGNGVSRYNGYEFENFSMNDGLPDNTVFEISEDYSGRIWFVPISCKLSYYYNGKIYSYKYNDELQKLFNNPIKTSFGVDKNGTVFLGVFHDGIYEISATGKITHHFGKDNSMGGVNVIQPDSNFMIYSSAGSNISHTISFNTSLLKGEIALKDNTYDMYGSDRVITTKKGLTLLTLLNKIYSFKNTHEYTVHTLPKRIIWLYEDRDEDLWVGTYLGGVYHFAKGNFNDQSVYLSGLPVNGILQDREGGFWFASEGNGVFYSPSKNILTYDKSVGLSSDKINCLATDGITIFSGTQNGFVNTIRDSVTGSYDLNSSGNPTNGISGLFYDTLKQRVWVSVGSIVNWSKNKKNILHGLSSFNRMLIDDNKKYWIAGSMCLSRVENDKEVFASNSKSQHLKRMNAILKNKNNTLLIGALDGLWLFDMKKETFQYLGDKNPLLKNRILDLAFTNDSLLLIATKGKGLLIYNMNERVYQIDESKGLCGNNVYRVVVDGESIWCATNKGLSKINITETEPLVYTLKKYTTLEGIASNEVNDILKLGKNLWVATNKGISVFDVNSEMNTDVHIPVYITKVMINDSVSELKSDYQLGYSQNNIRISFLGLGYKDPGKLEYRFKMAGLDSSWTISQNRDIQYTT
ncbi:MAG: ligand-binding sensor domain-containing protein, partial [Bacteroidia bacterium]